MKVKFNFIHILLKPFNVFSKKNPTFLAISYCMILFYMVKFIKNASFKKNYSFFLKIGG